MEFSKLTEHFDKIYTKKFAVKIPHVKNPHVRKCIKTYISGVADLPYEEFLDTNNNAKIMLSFIEYIKNKDFQRLWKFYHKCLISEYFDPCYHVKGDYAVEKFMDDIDDLLFEKYHFMTPTELGYFILGLTNTHDLHDMKIFFERIISKK